MCPGARVLNDPERDTTTGPNDAPEAMPDASDEDVPIRQPGMATAQHAAVRQPDAPTGESGGPSGPEPTRYGDWERNGRCTDF